ncbi:polysaccharide biosynthesis/export family protein [Parapedobacter sp. DT-150]|uniref:polysaccharide biosynthesis/export family protein n=1 Tax=Parapedobacter sp. DT-150 TaxID=3396162 RepID=UPI003F19D302
MTKISKTIFLFLLAVFCLGGCVTTKNTVYFGDIPTDSPNVKLPEYKEPVVLVDDILHITIQTIDGGTTTAINQLSGGIANAGNPAAPTAVNSSAPSGYLVDKEGQISMPMLGTLKVVGLTTSEVRTLVSEEAARYFKDPTVQVRFANFKITVIGEVTRPATYTVASEKINLLDALGMAGDLTIFGKRENVMLIRDNNGEKEFVRFNLNSYDTFTSPYFYLKQGDVIYVEPGKGKVAQNNAARTQMVSILASAVSIITVIMTRVL